MRLKRGNVPIPEAHVVGLILGGILHWLFPGRIFSVGWIGHVIGWPLIVLGLGLSIWAVLEAGEMEISSPDMLLTSGPYAFSRNPMYLGWTLVYLGIACAANAVWIIGGLPIVVIYVHWVDIPREEKKLEQEFGDEYNEYRRRVRRYI